MNKAPLEIHQFINKYAPELSYNDKVMMEADLEAIIDKKVNIQISLKELKELINPTLK